MLAEFSGREGAGSRRDKWYEENPVLEGFFFLFFFGNLRDETDFLNVEYI